MSAVQTLSVQEQADTSADSQAPLITVGMPVYNGQRYLAQAIESVLAQSWRNVELVISDNASTDNTAAIAQRYAQQDPRIRYRRFDTNRGVAANWNAVVHEARGEYFKWLAGNDRLAPNLLQRCAQVLNTQPDVVLCFGRTRWIDEDGQPMDVFGRDFSVTGERPSERFMQVACHLSINSPMNSGLIRTVALRRTPLMASYRSSDLVLMAELAMYGKFLLLPDELFQRRAGSSVSTPDRTPLQVERLFNPNATQPRRLVRLRIHAGRYAVVRRAAIGMREKLRAAIAATRLLHWDRHAVIAELKQVFLFRKT